MQRADCEIVPFDAEDEAGFTFASVGRRLTLPKIESRALRRLNVHSLFAARANEPHGTGLIFGQLVLQAQIVAWPEIAHD